MKPGSTNNTSFESPGTALTSRLFATVFLLALFVLVLVRTAWVCDDAYITFRVLDNFINGHGLRWNTLERVWVYTNPLWLFVFCPLYAITREAFFSSIIFSIVISAGLFLLVLTRIATGTNRALLAGLALMTSKAFVDFSTSGLENPLSHLLLAVFFILLLNSEARPRRPALFALIAAGALLTRPDSLLFYLPALLWIFMQEPGWKTVRAFLIGFSPVLAWELFALVYYGFPFPNTAYAKLGGAIAQAVRLRQGCFYFLSSADLDPQTLLLIAAGLALGFLSRRRPLALLAWGIVLQLLYVLWIGGDFMNGRFLSSALLGAVMLIAAWPHPVCASQELTLCAVVLATGLLTPASPLLTNGSYGPMYSGLDIRNVADERRYYFPEMGLLRAAQGKSNPGGNAADNGRLLRARSKGERLFTEASSLGVMGYFAGPNVHIIDVNGVTDAFVVRMPRRYDRVFRPGHVQHEVPAQYSASIENGRNLIADTACASLYDAVRCVTQDPLWSGRRWAEIIKLNTGGYQAAQRQIAEHYGNATDRIFYADLAAPLAEGTPWELTRQLVELDHPVTIVYDTPQKESRIELTLVNNGEYRLAFMNGQREVHQQRIAVPRLERGGLKLLTVDLPPALAAAGFDAIRIEALSGDGKYGLGHLRVMKAGQPETPPQAQPAVEAPNPSPVRRL